MFLRKIQEILLKLYCTLYTQSSEIYEELTLKNNDIETTLMKSTLCNDQVSHSGDCSCVITFSLYYSGASGSTVYPHTRTAGKREHLDLPRKWILPTRHRRKVAEERKGNGWSQTDWSGLWEQLALPLDQTCGLHSTRRRQVHLRSDPHWTIPDLSVGYVSALYRRLSQGCFVFWKGTGSKQVFLSLTEPDMWV